MGRRSATGPGTGPGPAPALRAWVAQQLPGHLPSQLRFVSRSWSGGSASVWRVEAEKVAAYLKVHGQPRKFEQERLAYQRWLSRLPDTPELLAVHTGSPQALLLSAVPGEPLLARHDPAAFVHAGAWLRQLHALPWTDDDPLALGQAHRRRAASWLARAGELLDRPTRSWIERCGDELQALDGTERVPCHRDFSPRNWLVAGERLWVIDAEHARADWWLADCERLVHLVFAAAPALAAAFWRGYGRRPDPDEARLLRAYGAVQAVATLVWARDHNDPSFAADGRAVLERLRDS